MNARIKVCTSSSCSQHSTTSPILCVFFHVDPSIRRERNYLSISTRFHLSSLLVHFHLLYPSASADQALCFFLESAVGEGGSMKHDESEVRREVMIETNRGG